MLSGLSGVFTSEGFFEQRHPYVFIQFDVVRESSSNS